MNVVEKGTTRFEEYVFESSFVFDNKTSLMALRLAVLRRSIQHVEFSRIGVA